jgi:uncharacterized protein (DUF927 family)
MTTPLPFFAAVAAFCQELAPVASPLISVLGETSAAVHRAQETSAGRTRLCSAAVAYFPEDDEE